MKFSRIVSFLTACGLCLALGACQQPDDLQSVPWPAEPAPSSAAEATPAPTPAPSATETPAPTPGPTPGTGFDELFTSQNPIEDALQEELELADNYSALLEAYITAIERYRRLADLAYQQCQAVLPVEDKETLEARRTQWEAGIQAKREEVASAPGEPIEGYLPLAESFYGLYKNWARDLCWCKFDADGVMPSIADALEEPVPAG